jgi:hypothetical protein
MPLLYVRLIPELYAREPGLVCLGYVAQALIATLFLRTSFICAIYLLLSKIPVAL